jgi:hypothetical protein
VEKQLTGNSSNLGKKSTLTGKKNIALKNIGSSFKLIKNIINNVSHTHIRFEPMSFVFLD